MSKEEIITFKVDAGLAERLRQVPNRSDFIRKAILEAFKLDCPICQGTGLLEPEQMLHVLEFLAVHPLTTCPDCHSLYPSCTGHPSHIHGDHP